MAMTQVISASQNIEGDAGNKEKGLQGRHALNQIGHRIGLNRVERPQACDPNREKGCRHAELITGFFPRLKKIENQHQDRERA